MFDPPAKRQSDTQLLALANGDTGRGGRSGTPSNAAPTNAPTPPGAPGAAPGTPFGATAEQRAALALQNRKWQMIYEEGAAVVLEPGRGDGGTVFLASATMPPPTQMGSRDNQQSTAQNQQPA